MLALVMLAAPSLAFAADESADFLIKGWTSENNLPDDGVSSLVQTPDGYLWVGTYNGLARFDGMQFTTFDPANTPELKHARVTGLFTGAAGKLWINTYDGFLTSLQNGVFTREWRSGAVSAVYSASNRTYFATLSSGVFLRKETSAGQPVWQMIQLAKRNEAMSFSQDSEGAIWFVLRDGRFGRIVGTNSTLLNGGGQLVGDQIQCLAADHKGQVWVGTQSKIARWQGGYFVDETPTNGEPSVNTTFLFFTRTNGFWAIANGVVRHAVNRRWVGEMDAWPSLGQAFVFERDAYETDKGDVWFRQLGKGLFYNRVNGSHGRICATNGLPSSRVTCWLQDREGNLWAGMDRGGIVRLQKKLFQVVGGGEARPNVAASTVCEDVQSNVWVGTIGGGLIRWRDGLLDYFNLSEGANQDSFYAACPDSQDRLWLSADREDLFVLETNQIVRSTNRIHGIKSVLVGRQNQVWLGRLTELTQIKNDVVSNYGEWNGFDRCDVRALAEDTQGALWIGSGNGTIYKFIDDRFVSFKPDDAREDQAVWSLLPEDDGTVWAGTFRGGLLRFKNGGFTRYTTASGLPSDTICQILDDGLGRLWFGSRKGIFFVPDNSFEKFDRGEIATLPCTAYDLSDGLPTLECSGGYTPSCWRCRDGKLWFATSKGAVSVNPRDIRLNSLEAPVIIEDFLLDGKSLNRNHTNLFSTSPMAVRISPGKHQLDFHFTALNFTAPEKIQFRYKLASFDNDWVEAGVKRTAHYGPLPPGDYKFQVIACNNDGVWNETGASFGLKQLPFFWQTWWFAFLAAAGLTAAIATAVRRTATRHLHKKLEQLKQQQAIERERDRIATDIHDELGAGLTQILLQSSIAQRESQGRTQSDLAQISETARSLVRTMDEIVWAVTPENDTLDGLITYVGKYVLEFCAATKLRCRLHLPPKSPVVTVSAETRHHLFLAVKESLNNIVKHAQADQVSFELKMRPGEFAFIIKDDGVGFKPDDSSFGTPGPERISAGHGLRNLVKRLNEIGGRFSITSSPGQGTTIELIVPTGNDHRLSANLNHEN